MPSFSTVSVFGLLKTQLNLESSLEEEQLPFHYNVGEGGIPNFGVLPATGDSAGTADLPSLGPLRGSVCSVTLSSP